MKKIILILICLFLTACNYHEIESLDVVSSIYLEKNINYNAIIEVSYNDESKYINSSGLSINECLSNANRNVSNTLYYNHLKVLIINDIDLKEVINYFLRNNNFNNDFYIIKTTSKTNYNGNDLKEILKKNNYNDFFSIAKKFYNKNIDIVLPIINADIITSTILNNSSDIDLNVDETKLLMLLNKHSISFNITYKDYNLDITVHKTNVKYELLNEININVDIEVTLNNINKNDNLLNQKNINELENIISNYLENKANILINDLNNKNLDPLGLKEKMLNKYHKSIKLDKINITFNTHINKKGLLLT